MQFFLFLVFFIKDIKFILKNFWPHRSDAKGFSIENLARKYREKISYNSPNETPKDSVNDSDLNSFNIKTKHIFRSDTSSNRVHWANRDFSEYRNVA